MKEGIRLLDSNQAAQALPLFERALELRLQLPQTNPVYAFGLAACWLNRGDALKHRGDAAAIAEAIASYDAGLAALQPLPLDSDARFPRRLAIGHQNRGLLLLAQGRLDAAVNDLHTAIGVLERAESSAIEDRQYLIAAAWLNLAMARAAMPGADAQLAARHAALRAVALSAERESHDAAFAQIGLTARHLVCRTMIDRLTQTPGDAIEHDVHEATDAVDEGLELARAWERQGHSTFRELACDLLRFGSRVYASHQPQHLEEFINENVDPKLSSDAYVSSEEIRSAVEEARRLRRGRAG